MSTVRLPSTCLLGSAPQSLKTSPFAKTQVSLGSMRSISKTFDLKANSGFRASAMAAYKVKLVTPEGEEVGVRIRRPVRRILLG